MIGEYQKDIRGMVGQVLIMRHDLCSLSNVGVFFIYSFGRFRKKTRSRDAPPDPHHQTFQSHPYCVLRGRKPLVGAPNLCVAGVVHNKVCTEKLHYKQEYA